MHQENVSIISVRKDKKYNIHEYPNNILEYYCNHCRVKTTHRTIVEACTVEDFTDDGEVFSWNSYHISECMGCHMVSFIKDIRFSEDEDTFHPDYGKKNFKGIIYPILEEGALTESQLSQLQFVLPDKVKAIYEETLTAIKNKLFIIAGIGLRAILDTVCRERKIGQARQPLAARLQIMCDINLITEQEKTVLSTVKDLGNDSAHEGKSLNAYEVESVLLTVEYLLGKIYLLPAIQRDLERGKEKFSIDEVFGDESPEVVSNEQ
ncbi:MAG: DUF4145 domain-containing protein [Lentisphaerae bacterium]|nr:DUF4145 domain-containing protein [Lentisphaerota bacterium]